MNVSTYNKQSDSELYLLILVGSRNNVQCLLGYTFVGLQPLSHYLRNSV